MTDKVEKADSIPRQSLVDVDERAGFNLVSLQQEAAKPSSVQSARDSSLPAKADLETQPRPVIEEHKSVVPTVAPESNTLLQPARFTPDNTAKPQQVTEMTGLGRPNETPKPQSVPQETSPNAILNGERVTHIQDSAPAKAVAPQAFAPENLSGAQKAKPSESLLITPISGENYRDSSKAQPTEIQASRAVPLESAPQPAPAPSKMTLGDLAAKWNQGDSQPQTQNPPKVPEAPLPKSNETLSPIDKTHTPPTSFDGQRSAAVNEAPRITPPPTELTPRSEVAPAGSNAQIAPVADRPVPVNPSTVLQGHISSPRESSQDASAATSANRNGANSAERLVSTEKTRNEAENKTQIEGKLADRQPKSDSGKIETIDARSTKGDTTNPGASSADAIKSNRTETISTGGAGKSDKVDTSKSHDDSKGRADVGNSTKREPLIIPGVITGRTADAGGGPRGTKTEGKTEKTQDAKPGDAPKLDPRKTEGGVAGGKVTGTANDALAGKKDVPKADKADKTENHGEQHSDSKVAATTSNVISGVAGRIVDGLSNIKDKLIPGAKPNLDNANDRANSRSEIMDHLTQPKPIEATLIGRDLKNLAPTAAGSEFVLNTKNPLVDPREETLSSKAGGLKQALNVIFGNKPDLVSDLKANEFPGPKTVPFETTQPKQIDKISETKVDDSGYLRNQKGDKVPTGDLKAELAELKANADKLNAEPDNAERYLDKENKQQIKDFTVQLGEIAKGATPLPNKEWFTADDAVQENEQQRSEDEEFDSRYLYYVKEGDTLRSIFDSEVPHEIGNTAAFEFFVKINEQTVRLASVLSADSMSLVLRVGTVLKLPTPRQIAQLKIV